jgi:protein-L-isoaspartate(D-aspartate) O-methyltransferase
MVDKLVRGGSITTPPVEAAFRSTPRHLFLPDIDREVVYTDDAIPIKHDEDGLPISSSSQPAMMATMLEQLALSGGESVLEIGTGSGYNAALLGALVGDGGRVQTPRHRRGPWARAQQHLRSAGATNVHAVAADGWSGFEEESPYDRVEVTVGVWDLSLAWVDQLVPGGIIVVPLWLRAGVQASIAFRRDGSDLVSIDVAPCGFMRLRGPHAGPEAYLRLDGWVLCDEATDPSQRDAARRLLESPATSTHAPKLPRGWFTMVALSHPHPIRMWTTQEPWLDRQGIILPDRNGLAVTEGDHILTFGDARARDELLRVASTSEGDLEQVTVRARRGSVPPDTTDEILMRPTFSYSLSW